MSKRLIALILVTMIFTTSFTGNVYAKSDTAADAESDEVVDTERYLTVDEICELIRDCLLKRKETITITMNGETYSKLTREDVVEMATNIDEKNTSKDGDYLLYSLRAWSSVWRTTGLGYIESATLTLGFSYHTTLKQEKKLDAKIKSVLDSLKLEGKSDYSKVKAVHDYIIKRVSYDFSGEKYSAYNALIDKSSVCQGYASLAYRMFLEAGIDCRIIGASNHVWNIVKVDGKWYNIDLTWDDPNKSTGPQVKYDYFLKNSADFKDHAGYNTIMTKEFTAKYPIAKNSYKFKK